MAYMIKSFKTKKDKINKLIKKYENKQYDESFYIKFLDINENLFIKIIDYIISKDIDTDRFFNITDSFDQ